MINTVIRIKTNFFQNSFVDSHIRQFLLKIHPNKSITFINILIMDKQTKANENITSFAKEIMYLFKERSFLLSTKFYKILGPSCIQYRDRKLSKVSDLLSVYLLPWHLRLNQRLAHKFFVGECQLLLQHYIQKNIFHTFTTGLEYWSMRYRL